MSDQRTEPGSGRAMKFGKNEQEVVVAAVLLAAFLYLRINIADFITGRRGGAYVDPDFWPGWLLNAAIVFSLLYLAQQLLAIRRERAALAAPDAPDAGSTAATTGASSTTDGVEQDEELVTSTVEAVRGNTPKLLLGFALLWAYIYSMRFIGFVPATLVFAIVFLVFVGERRWKPLVFFPIGFLGILIYIFTRLLVVPLPRGSGFFLELSTYIY